MVLIHEEKTFYFISQGKEEDGIQQLNNTGSSFKVTLRTPIAIEKAVTATLQVNTASIWNSSPNISEQNGNNHFYINDEDIVIPNGLYGVSELNNYLQQKVSDKILITGDPSTQKSVITFIEGATIHWHSDSIWEILGFDEGSETTAEADENVYGDTVARFNRISGFYLKSDLIQEGIPQNNLTPGLIASIPITAKPGSIINYEPFNPVTCNAKSLIGNGKQTITFTLLDQLLRPVIALETWQFSIVIKYSYFKAEPISIARSA